MMKHLLASLILGLGLSSGFAASLTLTGTVRDLTPANPDFENPAATSAVVTGLVDAGLTGAAPALAAAWTPGQGGITSAASFAEWFGASAPSVELSIELTETSAGSGVYRYENTAFFPIDGRLLGNYGSTGRNYHFTYAVNAQFDFERGAGQTFTFSGDDDVWVFFDKTLGIDLGGTHSAASASVDLDTLMGSKPSGTYSFDFFFAERHTTASNLSIETSLRLMPVPEASTLAMSLPGVLLVLLRLRRRRPRPPAA